MKNKILLSVFGIFFSINSFAQCSYTVDIINNDTIICGGIPIQLEANISGNLPTSLTYTWTPSAGLNNPNIANPIATPTNATNYTCTVSGNVGNNLITNGDFELGNTSFTSGYTFASPGTNTTGNYSIVSNAAVASPTFIPCIDHTPNPGNINMMAINSITSPNIPFWCQNVTVLPNTDYIFSMWTTTLSLFNFPDLYVNINGNQVNATTVVTASNCTWQEITFVWNSGNSSSADICILNQNTLNTGNDFAIDDISFFEYCSQTDDVFIDLFNPVTFIEVRDSFCFEDSFFVAGDWQQLPGIYYDIIPSQITGCDSIVVETELTIIQVVQFNFGLDRSICPGDSVLIKFEQPDITYLWNTGDTTEGIYVKEAGTYFLTTTSLDGCLTSDTVDVIVEAAPEIIFSEDTLICAEGTLDIFVRNLDNYTYLWEDNSTDSSFTATAPGTYSVVVSNANFGCPNTGSITITETPPLLVDLGRDTAICESIPLEISLNVPDAVRYEWIDGTTETTYTADSEQELWVNVYDVRDCKFSDTLEVTFRPVPEEIFNLPTDTTICINSFVSVQPFSPNATTYAWEGEDAYFYQNKPTDTAFIVTFPGTYTFTATNLCGGVSQFMEVTEADCGCYPFVPDAFTPNNDGINDLFQTFSNCEIQNYQVLIFDRWGNKVYQSNDLSTGWDGTNRGSEAKAGIYVWQMTYKTIDENGELTDKQITGDLTLVR